MEFLSFCDFVLAVVEDDLCGDDDENIFGADPKGVVTDIDIFGDSPGQCGKRNCKKKTNLNVSLTKVVI